MTQEYRDMTEEDRIVRILRQLPDEPPAPSTVDVARTMVEGRRRRRARRWSAGVGLAAVTAIAAGGGTAAVSAMRETAPVPVPAATPVASRSSEPVKTPTGCRVALLPTGDITKALVTSGDPTGRYLAGRVYPPGRKVHTVLWKDGVLQPRPAMPGADASFEDINSAGLAVGTSFDGDRQQAYASTAETTTRLKGGRAVAAAVNDKGVIAGTLGEPHFGGVPTRWPSLTAAPVKLPLPAGFIGGDAGAIAEDGTIAGTVQRTGKEGTGYLWLPDGSGRLMPPPTFKDGSKATHFWPESIIDGVVLGRGIRDGGDGSRSFESFRYRIATGKYERLPIELFPPAIGAANGWVLGTTNGYAPVVVSGEEVVQLPKYKGMTEYVVSAFSADGKSGAGYTTDTTDAEPVANRPLRWTCS
ncbi:hypothetical protein [Actinoplanes solisilvae]|uniref:hypothetical protein n=1 Tax=Actinoplanes solisilvae TaxID=2486853 RepID=UPI000FDBC893|nr:hypothetical protein [Actinoplanes solisilvae]